MKKLGYRKDEGKLRMDLLPNDVVKKLAEILTMGANKYEDRNWELGMKWSRVIGSLKRHLSAIEDGIDYDEESKLRHIDHVIANAAFLSRYYDTHPEYDDRPHKYLNYPKIGLDIDGVLANFTEGFCKKFNIDKPTNNWVFTYGFSKKMKEIADDEEFWMNLEPLVNADDLKFEPVCYVTARQIPTAWTETWLEKNGFACVPVISTKGDGGINIGNKDDILKEYGVEIFVDDAFGTFVDLNNKGICTYLMDTPWNKKYEVGYKRLYNLNDLIK